MIKITRLTKMPALQDIDMDIPSGITFIKGKNGSGKTTLFDCIAGIDRDFTGEISGNESIIYLNQQLYFYGRLKGQDLIEFLLGLNGIRQSMDYYESNLKLSRKKGMLLDLLRKPVGKLSGGELKLFYFSVITVIERQWYLFDEPFSQVDEDGKADMAEVFRELRREGKNVILTSHEDFFLQEIPEVNVINMDFLQDKR